MGLTTAATNLSLKAMRRLLSAHKPFQRRRQRLAREGELESIARRAAAVEHELGAVAAGNDPIIAGPWLAEVGYEVLYWVPFLRWFQDRYRVRQERMVALSRGGVESWYQGIAAQYVDIFDVVPPAQLSTLNEDRQRVEEAGGRKQFGTGGPLEERLLTSTRERMGLQRAAVLAPSTMFRLFHGVWHGNLPMDALWSRTRFAQHPRPPRPAIAELPAEYAAVKLYTGTALPDVPETRAAVRTLVRSAAEQMPVVVLDTGLAVDDHVDFALDDLPGVLSARNWMTPRTNLGVQTALVAHARRFISTCGGLAWLAPFLGVPTVGVYADDSLLAMHQLVARDAGRRVGAAEFCPVDLRAWRWLAVGDASHRAPPVQT